MLADKIRRMLPRRLKNVLRRIRATIRTIYWEPQYRRSIRELNSKPRKEVIDVAIFTVAAEYWNSFETVYRCMRANSKTNVTVYVFPAMLQADNTDGNKLKKYCTTLAFFKERGIDVVKAYDPDSGKWLSPEAVKADYIFYDQPYEGRNEFNICKMFKSAKICYIPYGYMLSKSENLFISTLMPDLTFRLIYTFFAPGEIQAYFAEKLYKRIWSKREYHRVMQLGYPRFDIISDLQKESHSAKGEKFTVLWNPRTFLKGDASGDVANQTTFFEFREKINERAASHDDEYWIVRPHPVAFPYWVSRGLITWEEIGQYISSLDENPRAELDRDKNYLDAFMRSDVMLADFSSILIEYIAFGKPIVYCGNHDAIPYDEMLEAMYLPSSWDEAMTIIDNLKKGIDPLAEKRKKFAEKVLSGGKSGERITQFIIDDYTKGGSVQS